MIKKKFQLHEILRKNLIDIIFFCHMGSIMEAKVAQTDHFTLKIDQV